jgi:endogenous inhibitor of DNA gyrase (YacG/DUF329 family)
MTTNDNTPPGEPRAQERKDRACPICGKRRQARYDPFCSRRCADVDLHRWLKWTYVIPGESATPEPSDEE